MELGPDQEKVDPRNKAAHDLARKTGVYSLRVRYVRVEGRWADRVALPIKAGDVLSPEKLFDAMEALEKIITADSIGGYGLRSKGEVGVLYIEVNFDTSEAPASGADLGPAGKTVGLIFRPYYVHFSLERVGNNVLPIPRSPWPTFYENVPKPLLALKPIFGASYDRAFGTAVGAALDADLLNASDPARISAKPGGDRHLYLHADGAKSLESSFFRADTSVRYNYRRLGSELQEFTVGAGYSAVEEPLGGGRHTRHGGWGVAGAALKLGTNARLFLDAGYARTDDETTSDEPGPGTQTSAGEQRNRLLVDLLPRPIGGFLRAAVWEDNGWLSGGQGSYQRLVARVGYGKEIAVAAGQTIGLELVAGAGKVWGDAPAYARFFGGTSPGQFLYEAPSSTLLTAMPAGPLLRSFGEGAAGLPAPGGGVRGSSAFWHVNFNVAVPVRPWSRPLIPDEITDIPDADGNGTPLKKVLRNQVDITGPSMLAATLKQDGASDEEAARKAEEVFREIQPATHFFIDDANLYAVKPLLLFDAAGMTGSGGSPAQTWVAAGGGLQVTVVTAKLEAGYMWTLSGPTFGSRGNAFVRLVFQNLF